MANFYVSGTVAIATGILSNCQMQSKNVSHVQQVNVIAHNYAFIDFKQWLTNFCWLKSRTVFTQEKMEHNLNSELPLIGNFCAQISEIAERKQSNNFNS